MNCARAPVHPGRPVPDSVAALGENAHPESGQSPPVGGTVRQAEPSRGRCHCHVPTGQVRETSPSASAELRSSSACSNFCFSPVFWGRWEPRPAWGSGAGGERGHRPAGRRGTGGCPHRAMAGLARAARTSREEARPLKSERANKKLWVCTGVRVCARVGSGVPHKGSRGDLEGAPQGLLRARAWI